MFEVEFEQKLTLLDILVRRTESNFEYSVYRKPTNENALLHFLFFYDIKKSSVLTGSCLGASIVGSPINLYSEI